jgi:hypothetical protein
MEQTSFVFTDIIPPDSVIALGDCHGCYDQFARFLDWVGGSGARVVLLGDLIDRGPNDLGVLIRVRQLLEDPESWGLHSFTSLRGNHEQMFLNALDHPSGWSDWIRNGGDVENVDKLEEHAGWIRELPYFVTVGDTLFSHTGGFYGVDPATFLHSEEDREQLVWARMAPHKGSGLAKWSPTLKRSVFGHTPRSSRPYAVGDSICIDTGCFHTETLTAYNATNNTFKQFELQ